MSRKLCSHLQKLSQLGSDEISSVLSHDFMRWFCGLSASQWNLGLIRENLANMAHQQVALSAVSFAAAKLNNRARILTHRAE